MTQPRHSRSHQPRRGVHREGAVPHPAEPLAERERRDGCWCGPLASAHAGRHPRSCPASGPERQRHRPTRTQSAVVISATAERGARIFAQGARDAPARGLRPRRRSGRVRINLAKLRRPRGRRASERNRSLAAGSSRVRSKSSVARSTSTRRPTVGPEQDPSTGQPTGDNHASRRGGTHRPQCGSGRETGESATLTGARRMSHPRAAPCSLSVPGHSKCRATNPSIIARRRSKSCRLAATGGSVGSRCAGRLMSPWR